ncbi:putative fungal-specific transcription factor [Cladorrhinum sp. PSN332]|nr:putative fungal-specific transcription factor [Cladorrhinum sp. PSN332]
MADYSTPNPITTESGAARSAAAALNTATAPGTSSSGEILACYVCKRRKVKCDRKLPICSLCSKLNIQCEYPAYAGRPGPKPGSQGTKRRRLDHSAPPPGPTSPFDCARRDSALSPASCYSSSAIQDDSISRRDNPTPEGGAGLSPSSTRGRRLSNHSTTAPIFSRIMYPSHEAQTRPQSPSTVDTPSDHQGGGPKITVQSVCEALKITKATYDMLMTSYFNNMTAFSLFKPGSIEPKFAMMQYHSDAEALVAAMFSFSARHCRDASNEDTLNDVPSPAHFAQIASKQLDESVERYGELRPPFWLLQAGILVTFYQLTLNVRSRSWKKLGDCIRYSYDVSLHMVDANHDPTEPPDKINLQRWSLLEERRRAWWAVWEMDVFASTIRRLPTAIDGSMNLTMLPVPDSCWFNDVYQESCFLAADCSLRWKHLAGSGNKSAKAWFIVVNSLMRNTQRIVYPVGSAIQTGFNAEGANRDELNIMANCLYCTVTSLPGNLAYQGETLDFRLPKESRQDHADKYALHLMTQLCRFMIYHHKICARAPWLKSQSQPGSNKDSSPCPLDPSEENKISLSEWSNYMNASDEIITVVRNSSRDHYRYVNPFLVNTIWFAAAVQCACRVFDPPVVPAFNKRLAGSNLDLLKLTMDRFVEFWGGMESLKGKLARIESGLVSLMGERGQRQDRGEREDRERRERDREVEINLGERRAVAGLVQMAIDTGNSGLAPGVLGSNGGIGVNPLMVPAGGGASPVWPFAAPVPGDYLCDFTQPFAATAGQHFFGGGEPVDLSPFGLEEVLMAGMDSQQFRGAGGGAGAGGFPYRM